MHYDALAIAPGTNFQEGLSGMSLCGRNGSVMLLSAAAAEKNTVLSETIRENASRIRRIYILGDTNAVPVPVRRMLDKLLN